MTPERLEEIRREFFASLGISHDPRFVHKIVLELLAEVDRLTRENRELRDDSETAINLHVLAKALDKLCLAYRTNTRPSDMTLATIAEYKHLLSDSHD